MSVYRVPDDMLYEIIQYLNPKDQMTLFEDEIKYIYMIQDSNKDQEYLDIIYGPLDLENRIISNDLVLRLLVENYPKVYETLIVINKSNKFNLDIRSHQVIEIYNDLLKFELAFEDYGYLKLYGFDNDQDNYVLELLSKFKDDILNNLDKIVKMDLLEINETHNEYLLLVLIYNKYPWIYREIIEDDLINDKFLSKNFSSLLDTIFEFIYTPHTSNLLENLDFGQMYYDDIYDLLNRISSYLTTGIINKPKKQLEVIQDLDLNVPIFRLYWNAVNRLI